MATDPVGDVWIADQGNSRVEEFSAIGRYRTSFAVPAPAGIGLDVHRDVWVSSPAYAPGNSVQEFSPAGHELRSFGTTQAGYGDLGDPGGIAVGPAGRIYVVQPDYGLVSVFSPAGRFYTEFGLQPGTGQAAEDLEFPQGLAVTASGEIWVADSGHNRVVEFGRVPGIPVTGASAAPGGPSQPLIIGECLLALVIVGLGWYLARRRQPDPGTAATPADPSSPAPAAAPPPTELSRRRLLTTATALTGVSVGAAVLPASLRQALAAAVKEPPGGSLRDVEHIVILMQENRSFDHYFGTMPGVRGFSDPAAIKLPDGSPVFRQPHLGHAQGYLTPFRLDTSTTSAQATPGTDHSWATRHEAWHNGKMDQWVQAKGPFTMGYFTQADIPFQWASGSASSPGRRPPRRCGSAACASAPPGRSRPMPARAGFRKSSWLVAPTAQSEHPDYFPAAGAEYIAGKLDAIASNGELWRKTLFILTYDENDGLFDHVPPPVAPPGTPGEYVGGKPIGLGFRVPAVVVSPWSAGGRVCSDVLDHTSLIRIIEKRFGVPEPNISAFRRRACGDFTSALRFSGPSAGYPQSPAAITLAAAEAGLLTAQQEVFANPAPLVPVTNEPVPRQ